jgi:hypothetical protein
LWDDERRAVSGVETLRQVSGQFEVLTLVLAYRHSVGVVGEDVGRHEARVGEKADPRRLVTAFSGLVLELGHPRELPETRGAFHQPRELGMRRNVALQEQRARLGIQPSGEEQSGHRQRRLAALGGITGHGQAVQVNHAVVAVTQVLVLHPIADSPEQVAQVRFACRLYTRENPRRLRIG